MTIQEIRSEYEQLKPEQWNLFIDKYLNDTRSGVQKIIKQCRIRIKKAEEEDMRLENMLFYERKYYETYDYVCGIDEAGRGPLAGPVCAAAVILPPGLILEGVNDSKKLTEKKREKLFDVIIIRQSFYVF